MPKQVWKAVLLIEAVDLPSVGYTQVSMVFDESSESILEKQKVVSLKIRFTALQQMTMGH